MADISDRYGPVNTWRVHIDDDATSSDATSAGRWERRVRLRPVAPGDFELLYAWSTAPDVSHTWRYRGATPSPEVFARDLWTNVLCQFVGIVGESDLPVGLVTLYDASFSAQRATMSCLVDPSWRRSGVPLGMVTALLSYAFETWPLRKVYFETNDVGLAQYRSAVDHGFMVEEARLRSYEQFGDGWVDLIYLSITAEGLRDARAFFDGTQRTKSDA